MRNFFHSHKIAGVIFAIVVFALVFGVVGVAISSSKHLPPQTHTSQPLPAVSPVQPAPAAAPIQQAPSTPSMTPSQQQAVQAAQGYLSDGEGFSAYSLNQQLTSSFGDGFSQADSQFAINYLNPNWDTQAVEAAQGYVNDGEGFSQAGLTQQLTSTYGDGFTNAQADYAVSQVMP
jgi:Host cell surface-exposed lipoprotein